MPRKAVDWGAEALALAGAAKVRPSNQAFPPELARLGSAPPSGPDWVHELKWDGYRLVAAMANGEAKIWSRNGLEWTSKQPRIAAAIQKLGVESIALDGELVAGQGTQKDFNLLQATLAGEAKGPLSLVLFDLVHLAGVDLHRVPLVDRKALLARLLEKPPAGLAYSAHVVGDGAGAFDAASRAGFEGIISKRASSPYRPGRGDDWRKTKHLPSDEFAVVGWMPGKGARDQGIGSLLLAKPDARNGWRYVGRVGTGFTNELLLKLKKVIGTRGGDEPTVQMPTSNVRDLRLARWFPPAFVVEVYLRGISESGVLRQPSLKAVRLDKKPADLKDSDRS